jgi:hypothetical protein
LESRGPRANAARAHGSSQSHFTSGPVIALARNTMLAHIPSLAAPEPTDDRPLAADPRLVRVRSQVAVIRTLADRADHLVRSGEAGEVSEQLVEEMARLGCQLLEAAASLTEKSPPSGDSGIFAHRG